VKNVIGLINDHVSIIENSDDPVTEIGNLVKNLTLIHQNLLERQKVKKVKKKKNKKKRKMPPRKKSMGEWMLENVNQMKNNFK
jgi:hypothetical protein